MKKNLVIYSVSVAIAMLFSPVGYAQGVGNQGIENSNGNH